MLLSSQDTCSCGYGWDTSTLLSELDACCRSACSKQQHHAGLLLCELNMQLKTVGLP